ncbi:OsmC family protein [Enterobacter cloacae]|uniref:OsmC family protein n=1 Tax=Enterobacter cloacae TaxID=550 RepID=A0A377M6X8_ENTCL|nr:OsmC family protein [Enterobacter cloacae]
MSLEKVVYTAKAKATGGRDGRATSSDGVLDVKLGVPKEMGGMGGEVTNPEQLFGCRLLCLFPGGDEICGCTRQIYAAKRGLH